MISLIFRIVKQMKNDKRSLALMMLAPLMILTLVYMLLIETDYTPSILVVEIPENIVVSLNEVAIVIDGNYEDIYDYLESGKVDSAIYIDNNRINIKFYEPDSFKVDRVLKIIKNTLNPQQEFKVNFAIGIENTSTFDFLSSIFLALLSFFFIFLIAGISFIRERTTGTMERLLQTPIRRYEVVGGYTIGFGIFATIQSILIVMFSKHILNIEFTGSVILACFIMTLLAFISVSLGALVSLFANTEFQIIQFIPVVIIPQIFLSGLIPLDSMPNGLSKMTFFIPIYHGSKALKKVLLYSGTFNDIKFQIAILIVFIFVLFVLNTLALKKYRKI